MESGAVSVIMAGMMSVLLSSADSLDSRREQFAQNHLIIVLWNMICYLFSVMMNGDSLVKKKRKVFKCFFFFTLYGSGVSKARPMGYFGAGKGIIHLTNVRCTGKESFLGECPSKGQDSHTCKHGQDAGVVCDYLPEPEADIAVVGTHTCGLRAGAERRSKRIVGGYKSLR